MALMQPDSGGGTAAVCFGFFLISLIVSLIVDAFSFLCQFLFLATFFSPSFLVEFAFDALFGRKGKVSRSTFLFAFVLKEHFERPANELRWC